MLRIISTFKPHGPLPGVIGDMSGPRGVRRLRLATTAITCRHRQETTRKANALGKGRRVDVGRENASEIVIGRLRAL